MTKKFRSVLAAEIKYLHNGGIASFIQAAHGHGESLYNDHVLGYRDSDPELLYPLQNGWVYCDGYFNVELTKKKAIVTEIWYDESNFETEIGQEEFILTKGERSVVRNAMHRCRHDVRRRSKTVPHMTVDDFAVREITERWLCNHRVIVEKISDKFVSGYIYDFDSGRRVDEIAFSHLYGGTWKVHFYEHRPYDGYSYDTTAGATVTQNFLSACGIANEQGDYLLFTKNGVVAVG